MIYAMRIKWRRPGEARPAFACCAFPTSMPTQPFQREETGFPPQIAQQRQVRGTVLASFYLPTLTSHFIIQEALSLYTIFHRSVITNFCISHERPQNLSLSAHANSNLGRGSQGRQDPNHRETGA